jgi:hypothetical protein
MKCEHWNDEWVAYLYDELAPKERTAADGHLEQCADCRATLDDLARSSRILREAAPAVPDTSPIVVTTPRPTWQPAWAFVGGLACASLLFSIGLWAGPQVLGQGADADDRGQLMEALQMQRRQQEGLEQRLAAMEGQTGEPQAMQASNEFVTRDDLDRALDRIEADQAEQVRFLLGEITATERRAGNWIDETRNALHYVALKSDPRITEQ